MPIARKAPFSWYTLDKPVCKFSIWIVCPFSDSLLPYPSHIPEAYIIQQYLLIVLHYANHSPSLNAPGLPGKDLPAKGPDLVLVSDVIYRHS